MTRVLLLGPNGQLGTDIRRALASPDSPIKLKTCGRNELDVEELDTIRSVLDQNDFEVLINCTSFHKTDEVEDNGNRAAAVNAHAVREMAEACAAREARLVHISTDYVFGGDQTRPYSENDCPNPVNVYGATKLLGENLVKRSGVDALIVRVASLFGTAGASGKGGNFVETMLRLARDRGALKVVDDVRMSPTSTLTVARAIGQLLDLKASAGLYHVVNSGNATWYEFACEIVARAGLDVPVTAVGSEDFPTRAARPASSVLDNHRLEAVLGGPLPHWKDALGEYMDEKHGVAQ